jgi:transcriptional regulator with XRE-family HTH domain
MGNILFGIPKKCKGFELSPRSAHNEDCFPDNGVMRKADIRQLLTRRLNDEMDRAGMNQQALAQRAGISVSHLSEIRRGISSVTTDLLNDLAYALGCETWELLIDEEETRRRAIERAVSRPALEEEHGMLPHMRTPSYPRTPKAPAHRTRKKAPKKGSQREST